MRSAQLRREPRANITFACAVVIAVVLAAATGCTADSGPTTTGPSETNGANGTNGTTGPTGTNGTNGTSSPTLPRTDVPGARLTGPITGGRTGVPFNSMPPGLADRTGYSEQEFFIAGTARTFAPAADASLGSDGRWTVAPTTTTAPYTTRIVVRRPTDAAKFNGSVIVEWLNVSAGMDADPDFGLSHEELLRSGYAYVAVSAQAAGVMGGGALLPVPGFKALPLKQVDPDRYAPLQHPGDDYSYDVFAQVGAAIRHPEGLDPLDGLPRRRLIAVGESQSAGRMATFVNAIAPVTHTYDGFLIHSRGAGAAPITSAAGTTAMPRTTTIRTDRPEPVMQFVTETDLFTLGFFAARQPDVDKVRTWEVAGTAHADRSVLEYGIASGTRSIPDANFDLSATCGPINTGPQTYVLRKAIDALHTWVRDGTPPSAGSPLEVLDGKLVRDRDGNATGGIRGPMVDVPIAAYTGEQSSSGGGIFCSIFGSTTPFDAATLASRYPTHEDYVGKVTAAADDAVKKGHLLAADRTILVEAARKADIPPG